ncbi:MAG: SPOR domain-containing protein, partial [Thiovulaceae bacterium]|nr:SPOR domain-containing protein [Sulfurimonadaceae bacterium]
MDNTKNELNDIILNKGGGSFSSFKKILLMIATFAVLLIVVIVIMSSLNTNKKKGLTTTILPPEPAAKEEKNSLFRSIEVGQEQDESEQKRLESIAQEIKNKKKTPTLTPAKETNLDNIIKVPDFKTILNPKKTTQEKEVKKSKESQKAPTHTKKDNTGKWYVQVGSYEKNNPRTKLIQKIKKNNYPYRQMKTLVKGQRVTKVLIGPFDSFKEANKERFYIMKKIEPAAFV